MLKGRLKKEITNFENKLVYKYSYQEATLEKQKLAGAEDQPKQEIQMERGEKRRPQDRCFPSRFDYKLHLEAINILV